MNHETRHDPSGMLAAVRGLPDQLADAWARVRELRLPDEYRSAKAIALVGMGGSAIGGDLAAGLFADRLTVPMQVVRDYALPRWVDGATLVIASSYSGDTEETRSAFDDAKERGCMRVAVTSGGAVGQSARADGLPIVTVPAALQPRAALGHMLASVLGVLHAARLLPDPSHDVQAAAQLMRQLVDGLDGDGGDHPAARLAARLEGRIPIVYAPQDLAAVAQRWKDQMNENAKTTSAWDTYPELDHNAVVGYAGPERLDRRVHVVTLTGPGTHERIARRIEITNRLLEDHGIPNDTIHAPDSARVAQALWLVQLGDLVSLALAARRGIDPTPVDTIARLKAALSDA